VQVAKALATDKMQSTQSQSDTDSVRPGPSAYTTLRPHVDPPGRLSRDMWKHVLGKTVKSEYGKRKYSAGQCHVCAVHKSQARYNASSA
jgi:hypothetical protein